MRLNKHLGLWRRATVPVMTEKVSNQFKSERKSTDDSLDAERTKTNVSISDAREKAENQIDDAVQAQRTKADNIKDAERLDFDSNHSPSNNATADDLVNKERNLADKAMKSERNQADASIEREREIKRALIAKLLEQERLLTDSNLSHERSCTDAEVLKAADKLLNEINLHSKTKSSLTTRDEFAAIVSHDLKNPIGAAFTCSKMLLEDSSYRNLDPEVKHWITIIKRNVETSLRLITDLLDLERIAIGKLHVAKAPNLLAPLLEEAVETFSLTAKSKEITLQLKDCDAGIEGNFDRDRIAQVLSNLLGNATKFNHHRGEITVSCKHTDSDLVVSVADNGPGIEETKLLEVFERFAQINSKDRQGLGLGLYISKMLVEAHGGRLWVESKMGIGSTFSFSIPRA